MNKLKKFTEALEEHREYLNTSELQVNFALVAISKELKKEINEEVHFLIPSRYRVEGWMYGIPNAHPQLYIYLGYTIVMVELKGMEEDFVFLNTPGFKPLNN